jgi:O-antigen ligase
MLAVTGVFLFQYKHAAKKSWIALLIVPAAIAAILVIYGQDEYFGRIATITDTENNYNYTAEAGRLAVWKRGLEMMAANPLLGVGVDAFASAEGEMHSGVGKWSTAHNTFLQVGAELGVPGFLAFCIILGSLIRKSHRIGSSLGSTRVFQMFTSHALVGSLVGFIVGSFFLSLAYGNITYLLFGIAFAFLNIPKRDPISGEALSN